RRQEASRSASAIERPDISSAGKVPEAAGQAGCVEDRQRQRRQEASRSASAIERPDISSAGKVPEAAGQAGCV
ncbi:hypothetical protein WA841_33675, partial [Pseudomonas aeruginosa]